MKNALLYKLHRQLHEAKENEDVVYFLLGSRIKDFYKNNGIKINVILDKIMKIQEMYFVMENDKVKMEKRKLSEHAPETDEPVMQIGKVYEDYLTAYNELMAQDCVIKF